MNTIDLKGVVIPLVTPFTDDMSTVSEVRLARQIRSVMAHDPVGLLVGGDIGEFVLLTAPERKTVLEIVLRETANAVPVFVNASTIGTMPALDLAQHAKRHGARAIVIMPPYYGHFSTKELHHHIRTVANYSDQFTLVVDPQKQLDPAVAEDLSAHSGIRFPKPLSQGRFASLAVASTSTTDEFEMDDLISAPAALLEPGSGVAAHQGNSDGKAEIIAKAMHEHGKVRVAKALFQFRDLEMGPPRNPYQMCAHDVCKQIEADLAAL